MADIFNTENVRTLLQNKFIFMLGDSNMRASYKDLVLLINRNEILEMAALRRRGEESFEGDKRICYAGMSRGRQYVEGREFLKYGIHIEYHFITRCYTNEITRFFRKIKDNTMKAPDVVIMNSCIWDISRWGPDGVDVYKDNMKKLMLLLDDCLPKKTLFIWTTTLPVSNVLRGGLLIKQIDFLQNMLRFEVMEANLFCRHLIVSHGYDVLDTHYHLRMQIHRRLKDGLHYGPLPVRFITNLFLTHITLSWDHSLPGNSVGIALERIIQSGNLCTSSNQEEIDLHLVAKCLDRDEAGIKCKSKNGPFEKTVKSKRNTNFKRGNFRRSNVPGLNRNSIPIWKNNCLWKWPLNMQLQADTRHQEVWLDPFCNQQRPIGQHSTWNDYDEEDYFRNKYAEFDRTSSRSKRANIKYPNKRPGPY